MCLVPKFIPTYELIKPTKQYKDLRKGTILISNNPWTFYTITGWYADKSSRASKAYIFDEEMIGVNLVFMGYYQYSGEQRVMDYLRELLDNKIKTVKQLEKYLDRPSF